MSATNTRLAKRRTRDMIFFACLVALPLLHFFIFYICVNFNSILLAFKSYDSESGYQWVGLQNFKNLFSDFKTLTLYKYALKNSLLVFFVGTTVSTVLALFFSYYIYKKTTRMTKVFKVLLFMPSIIPAIAMATMFKQFAENAVSRPGRYDFPQRDTGAYPKPVHDDGYDYFLQRLDRLRGKSFIVSGRDEQYFRFRFGSGAAGRRNVFFGVFLHHAAFCFRDDTNFIGRFHRRYFHQSGKLGFLFRDGRGRIVFYRRVLPLQRDGAYFSRYVRRGIAAACGVRSAADLRYGSHRLSI